MTEELNFYDNENTLVGEYIKTLDDVEITDLSGSFTYQHPLSIQVMEQITRKVAFRNSMMSISLQKSSEYVKCYFDGYLAIMRKLTPKLVSLFNVMHQKFDYSPEYAINVIVERYKSLLKREALLPVPQKRKKIFMPDKQMKKPKKLQRIQTRPSHKNLNQFMSMSTLKVNSPNQPQTTTNKQTLKFDLNSSRDVESMSDNQSDYTNEGEPMGDKVTPKAIKENLYLKKQNTYVVQKWDESKEKMHNDLMELIVFLVELPDSV